MEKHSIEDQPSTRETESALPPPLDKEAILNRLPEAVVSYTEFMKRRHGEAFELDIDDIDLDNIDELEQLLGDDDEEFLGNLISFAAENGIDIEEFLRRLGVPVERIVDPSA